MTMYLVSFSGRLERHAQAARAELQKWGATRLWDDLWIVDMDSRPEDCLPGFVQTEAAMSIALEGSDMFFAIGRAAGMEAQLAYSEQIVPRVCPVGSARSDMADVWYCNGGEATFRRAVEHYFTTRQHAPWATELCRLMAGYGSDKAIGWHTYAPFYEALFLDRRTTVSAVLEVGLGTNNEDVPSNMGLHGRPGASLRAWRDYFTQASIYGADIDTRVLFSEDRIETFHVDQCDPASFDILWADIPDVELDIFLDDGLHTFDAARVTMDHSIERVKSGGYYIVEDIAKENVQDYLNLVAARGLPGMAIDIRHSSNIYDNCLVIAAIP